MMGKYLFSYTWKTDSKITHTEIKEEFKNQNWKDNVPEKHGAGVVHLPNTTLIGEFSSIEDAHNSVLDAIISAGNAYNNNNYYGLTSAAKNIQVNQNSIAPKFKDDLENYIIYALGADYITH